MDEPKYRIISAHFAKVKNKLLDFSRHFDIVKHGDIKGYGRETIVSEFLSSHLPDQVEYLTGEILDANDNRSGQIDIILQSKFYPKIPLWGNIHMAYSDAVMAIIEVKSNLTKQHLFTTLESFKKIKSLKRQSIIKGSNEQIDLVNIPCIIFAFTGPSKKSLQNNIMEFSEKYTMPFDEFAPDMVVILDSDYYICKNNGWIFPIVHGGYFRDWCGLPHENLYGLIHYLTNIIYSYQKNSASFSTALYFDKSILDK